MERIDKKISYAISYKQIKWLIVKSIDKIKNDSKLINDVNEFKRILQNHTKYRVYINKSNE